MAREKKLVAGIINVTMHPHSPEDYLKLFRDVFRSRKKVHISGDQYAMLTQLHKLDRNQDEPGPITGDIFKFTSIDTSANWFNTETNDFASEDDVKSLSIPDNLKPNSARFSYIFYPKQHLFVYEGYYDGKSFGPRNAVKFINHLLNDDQLNQKYGKVDVTHAPEKNSLDAALKMPFKRQIHMLITTPNPDTFESTERKFKERMRDRNIATVEQSYTAVSGSSIEVDEEIREIAKIAANNGTVAVKGRNEHNKPASYKTSDYPYTEKHYYEPTQSSFELFVRISAQMRDKVVEWFKTWKTISLKDIGGPMEEFEAC